MTWLLPYALGLATAVPVVLTAAGIVHSHDTIRRDLEADTYAPRVELIDGFTGER